MANRKRSSLSRNAASACLRSVITSNTATKCSLAGLYTEIVNHIPRACTYVSKLSGTPVQRHSAINLEHFRIGFADARNDLGHPLPHNVLQPGKGFKGVVHGKVDEVLRALPVEQHAAIGESVQHVLEQGAISSLALSQGGLTLPLRQRNGDLIGGVFQEVIISGVKRPFARSLTCSRPIVSPP